MVNRLTKYKNEKEIITGKLRRLEQRVRILEEKIIQDKEKVKLSETMLKLPNLTSKWKGIWNARCYYSLPYTIITGCSAKYLQMAIPIIIGAFFHDIDITIYFNSD